MGSSLSKIRKVENITIESLGLRYHSYQLYDVYFFGDTVKTLVTDTPCIIDTWISDAQRFRKPGLHKLVVGLDIEWRPNSSVQNPPATLQLCIGRNCLIIQLQFLPEPFPQSLISFLNNDDYTFVGVGIDDDVNKLYDFFKFQVSRTVDLRGLAAGALDERRLCTAGLKTLAKEVLGKEIDKPKYVARSNWDDDWLSLEQIQYACVDAYVSFQIDGGTEGVLNGIPVMGITTNTMGISPSKLRRVETFTEDEDDITFESLGLTYYSYQLYDVNFFGDTVKTLVTKTPCIIDTWISDTKSLHEHRLHKLVVGLDIEWRPNISSVQNPPATLQLCVGRNCLIIQLQFLPKPFPQSLISFLNNDNYTFVGVGINDDAYKLYDFFNVQVSRTADLRGLAGDALDERRLRSAGLKTLAKEVLGKEIDKPKYVSLSHWDDDWLSLTL